VTTPCSENLPARMPGLTRRHFIKGVVSILAGSALLTVGHARSRTTTTSIQEDSLLPGVTTDIWETLTRSTFLRHQGQTFYIEQEGAGRVAVQLSGIRDLHTSTAQQEQATTDTEREGQFSVIFSGPTGSPLEQGTYQFIHNQIGTFALMIVPLLPDDDSFYYEAIFNRF
jgi:hypothetical protein